MRIIKDLLNDKVYARLLAKFGEDGEFTLGIDYKTTIYCPDDYSFIPLDEKALGKYINAMRYREKRLDEVPHSIRTEEFYANTFCNDEVYDYIKDNVDKFDREFFKNVIMCNSYSLIFDKNCFAIMPLQYIDEEMVSLAILNATDWNSNKWLLTVIKRKQKAISEDVWKLAARLYGARTFIDILSITPEEYKDEEWYQELFRCQYNVGSRCDGRDSYLNSNDKTVLMDYVPTEVLTQEFLVGLLNEDLRNVARFNEAALETLITVGYDENGNPIEKKIWQYVIDKNGRLIDEIPLNDERIDYFKSLYPKDSIEYYGFKFVYRDYKRSKQKKTQNNNTDNLKLVLMDAMLYALDGEDPTKAIDNEIRRNREDMSKSTDLLPIFYTGVVPYEYRCEYDSEEYLEMMYEKYGIQVIEEYDCLLYKVALPEGLTIQMDGCHGTVLDENGEEIICFLRDDNFCNREAKVTYISDKVLHPEVPSSPDGIKMKTMKMNLS